MRVRGGPEGGLARDCAVHLDRDDIRDGAGVRARQLHEEVVRMLPVMERRAVAQLARREQVRVTAPAHCGGLQAEHGVTTNLAASERSVRHLHQPVDASELIGAARSALVDPLEEDVSHEIERPPCVIG